MKHTRIHLAWSDSCAGRDFSSAVSLHSHTLHSKESMEYIVRLALRVPGLAPLVRRHIARYESLHGRTFDPTRVWWTPPLTARAAYELESRFITTHLGIAPLVSLTDHDNIDAPMNLRVLHDLSDAPVSVEWSAPWENTFFHIGVHNMSPAAAPSLMKDLAEFTAQPSPASLAERLESLNADPGVLIVLNHPCWDENAIGKEQHRQALLRLLHANGRWIHAFEANGLRTWEENREVAALCRQFDKPLISGGDRHAREPNANLNLTNATSFPEFVEEVRKDGYSNVYFAPHAAEPLPKRIYRNLCDILKDDLDHPLGAVRWSDRVFYRTASGDVQTVHEAWSGKAPFVVAWFVGLVKLLDHDRLEPAWRSLAGARGEVAL